MEFYRGLPFCPFHVPYTLPLSKEVILDLFFSDNSYYYSTILTIHRDMNETPHVLYQHTL